MTIVYRRSGGEHSLTVTTAEGVQCWDLSALNQNQVRGAREMVVDHWCRNNGYAPLYAYDN